MTPKEALALLDNVVAQIVLKRDDHDKLRQAIATLENLITQSKPKEK
jgi:hypothetical protein